MYGKVRVRLDRNSPIAQVAVGRKTNKLRVYAVYAILVSYYRYGVLFTGCAIAQ